MDTHDHDELARVIAALGNPTRLGIVELLADGPRIVSDLIEQLGEAQSTISKHLGTLKAAGVLDCVPDGRCRMYALINADAVRTALHALRAATRAPADAPSPRRRGAGLLAAPTS